MSSRPSLPRPGRVFTASWGQLESAGSNIGDAAIFKAQTEDLSELGVEIGVLSADPGRTESRYRVKAFDASGSRLLAMLRAVLWADAVIVGGGELAQDVSSLLYTPFNLLPLRLSWWLGRRSFAWSIGLGQGDELAGWSVSQLSRWLARCRGVTARDRPTHRLLMDMGLNPSRALLSSDSAFSLAGDFSPGPIESDILGAAPRNVLNRKGRLLPLELRRKLGLADEEDPTPIRRAWAKLLDDHLNAHPGLVRMFPFHTGSLSNADDIECREIAGMMSNSDRVEVVDNADIDRFLGLMGECRAFLTVPLHGSILSVITGAVPVAIPYATKGFRFMSEAGLADLAVDSGRPGWEREASAKLNLAWSGFRRLWNELEPRRRKLIRNCRINRQLFEKTCLID